MFLIEHILAGICELFTGLDKLPCSAILLARTIHRSSVLREFPAVRCMLTIAEYYHCPIADVCQICISKNILLMPQSNLSAATSDDIRSGSELVKVERIQCLFLFFSCLFFPHNWSDESDELRFVTVDLFPVFVCHPRLTVTAWRQPSCHAA